MTPTMIALTILVVLIVTAVIAFALYKAGFRTTKWKVKTGLFEADLERTSGDRENAAEPPQAVPFRTEASQEAGDGGVIRKGRLSAPAESGARLGQKATGQGSRIDDSEIKLS